MMYLDWLQTTTEKRLTYVLGTQQTLRESVISRIISTTTNPDVITVDGDTTFPGVFFIAPIRQNTTRVVVVRNAEKVADFSYLQAWFEKVKNVKVIYDSTETEFSSLVELHGTCPRGHSCGIGQTNLKTSKSGSSRRTCKLCDTVAKMITYRGRFVDCSIDGTGVDLLKAVSKLSLSGAKAVMNYTGSIDAALELVDKHELLSLTIDEKLFPMVSLGNSDISYVRELTIGDKFKAVQYAATVKDKRAVFEYLAEWLVNLELVARHHINGKKRPEIATLTGLSWPQTSEYLKWVARYSQDKIDTASVLLANSLVDWRNGADTGLLQLLALNW